MRCDLGLGRIWSNAEGNFREIRSVSTESFMCT